MKPGYVQNQLREDVIADKLELVLVWVQLRWVCGCLQQQEVAVEMEKKT